VKEGRNGEYVEEEKVFEEVNNDEGWKM